MNETIGQQLRLAREAQKLTLDQVAGATLMRERYLRALEEDNFAALPSLAQARGFLRAYAAHLKLDPEPLLGQFEGKQPTDVETVPLSTQASPEESDLISYEQADKVFVEIGRTLQSQRELLGLTLEDVIRYTHLRQHYLEALEAGNIDGLPSPSQGRGMLENYAVFLGMDPEPVLLRYAEGLQARLVARQKAQAKVAGPPTRRKRPLPAPLRRLLSPDILIGVTFAVFLVIFMIWGAVRIFAMRAVQTPTIAAPSIADVLLATPSPGVTPTLQLETATAPGDQALLLPGNAVTETPADLFFPTGEATGVQVYLTILQRTWMRVVVDGEIQFEGRVIPGSAYPFVGEQSVEVLTSNGAGVRIFYNQQDLGILGRFGEIVQRIFTAQGLVSPTPTVTRTPTAILRVTPSPANLEIPGLGGTPGVP